MFSKKHSFMSTSMMLALVMNTVVLVSGCKKDEDPVTPAPGAASLMAVHASPNAPAVDILVDNAVAQSGLTFPNNTAYVGVASGTRNVKVRATGTTTNVIDANVPLAEGSSTSVFAVDSLSKISALVTTDDLTAPASGKAHIRFLHLSPNAPAVDVALQGGAVVFGNRAFKSFTAYTPLDAGTYDLEVRVAGTSTVALPLNGVQLRPGEIYTVFARGFLGATGSTALDAKTITNLTTSAALPGNGKVLITHASPNAPNVDLKLGNTNISGGTNVPFGASTPYLDVPAGARGIKAVVTGGTTVAINANVPVAANANYSIFAIDSVSKISALVLNDTLTTPATGKAHVRFVHLSPNAPAVDVGLVGGGVVFANRSFKQFTSFTPLDAGTYNLNVRAAGTTTVVLTLPPITLVAGKIYTVYAKGFLTGTGAQALGANIIANN